MSIENPAQRLGNSTLRTETEPTRTTMMEEVIAAAVSRVDDKTDRRKIELVLDDMYRNVLGRRGELIDHIYSARERRHAAFAADDVETADAYKRLLPDLNRRWADVMNEEDCIWRLLMQFRYQRADALFESTVDGGMTLSSDGLHDYGFVDIEPVDDLDFTDDEPEFVDDEPEPSNVRTDPVATSSATEGAADDETT